MAGVALPGLDASAAMLPIARRRLPAALALVLSLTACGGDSAPTSGSTSGPTASTLVTPGVPLDSLLAARRDDAPLLRRLDPPAQAEAEPVENRHVPGQTDTLRTLDYEGLQIEVLDVTGGPALIRRVAVQSVEWRTGEGVGVGSRRGEVEASFGAPVATDGPVATYETGGEPTPTRVEVRYDGDRAASLVWFPYVD